MTLLILLALTLLVALRLDHLGWIPYSLARDLPWAGLVLAGLALAAAVGRRLAAPEDAGWLTGPELAGRLRLRASWPGLAVYETGFAPSYLQDAAGSARFDDNRIEVRLDSPRDEVVLRFRWRPGLLAQPSLPVEAVDVGAAGPLIRVRPGSVRAFEVRY